MDVDETMGKGKLIDELFGEFCEGTFGRLRYILGGDRPSQTACLRWSTRLLVSVLESQQHKGGIPTSAL